MKRSYELSTLFDRTPPNGAPGATLQTPTEGSLRLGLQRRYPVWDRARL